MYYFLLFIIIYSFGIYLVSSKFSRKVAEIMALLLLSFLTLLIGLRYGVGIDYFRYKDHFDLYYMNFSYEILYSLLRYIIKVTIDKFYIVTLIMIFLSNYFIFKGLKARNISGAYILLALFIYISDMAIVFTNVMAQGVAVAIFFYASTYIEKRNFKKFIFFMLIGAGFHTSILLLIPLYFLKERNFKKSTYILLIIVSYALVYLEVPIHLLNFVVSKLPIYTRYFNNNQMFMGSGILSLGVLIKVILFLLIVLLAHNSKKETKNLLFNYYFYGVMFNILSLSTFLIGRIGMYFYIFSVASIPIFIESVRDKNLRLLLFIITLIISALFFAQTLLLDPASKMLEYNSIFSQ